MSSTPSPKPPQASARSTFRRADCIQLPSPMPQFSFPKPGPMFRLITYHCADPYRWLDLSRWVGPFLRRDGEEQDHIRPFPFLVPCGSRAVDSKSARMGRTAAPHGELQELNQRMWRVTQRTDLETSRCAAVPSRLNSSLGAHLYAMGRL